MVMVQEAAARGSTLALRPPFFFLLLLLLLLRLCFSRNLKLRRPAIVGIAVHRSIGCACLFRVSSDPCRKKLSVMSGLTSPTGSPDALSPLQTDCGNNRSGGRRSSVGFKAGGNKMSPRCLITEMKEADVAAAGEEEVVSPSSKSPRVKGSAQLARWARARRSSRSGRMTATMKMQAEVETQKMSETAVDAYSGESDGESDDEDGVPAAKCVYMVSDATGWTAEHAVHAALGQFEHCLVDRRCSVDTHLFSQINDVERLMEIIRQAAQEEALLFYTLGDPQMADAAKEACQLLHVPHVDILGPITDALQSHLGVSPSGLPRGAGAPPRTLSKQYFKRIEAVEFTIRQDDGALPKNLVQADIVLVGVSRTSKTPLSTYMAQKGYKVANVPLVFGIEPPKELFEVDQDKVYALTINPTFLKSIRLARSRSLGMGASSRLSYSDMEHICKELEYSRKLFLQHPQWPVVEVTGKAIEETAAVILRIYHERCSKHHMPRISRRY